MADQSQLRAELVAQYRRAGELRLNELASGNLSCRCGDGHADLAHRRLGRNHHRGAMSSSSGADGAWSGDHAPSSEWRMHAAIYRACPDARRGRAHPLGLLRRGGLPEPAAAGLSLPGRRRSAAATCRACPTPRSAARRWPTSAAAALARSLRPACSANHGMICRAPQPALGGEPGLSAGDHVPPVCAGAASWASLRG